MMTRSMLNGIAVAALAVAWPAIAGAGNLQREDVAADAKWLVHMNVEAAKGSTVMEAFWEQCILEMDGAREYLDEIREKWGVDVPDNVHAVTVYGEDMPAERLTIVARADVDQQTLREKLQDIGQTTEHRDHTIYTWERLEDTKHAYTVAMVIYQPDKLVVAADAEAAQRALDVLDGQTDRLAADSPLAADVPDGTIFLLRAIELDEAKIAEKLPVFQQLERCDVAEGEREGRWFGDMRIDAKTEQTAERLNDLFRGYLAAAALHLHEEAEAVELLDGVQSTVENSALCIDFDLSAQQSADQMPAFCRYLKDKVKWHHRICHALMIAARSVKDNGHGDCDGAR